MKVIHVSQSDSAGGAARAAYRIHQAIRSVGIDSEFWVVDKRSSDPTVIGLNNRVRRVMAALRGAAARFLVSLLTTANSVLHSPGVFRSPLVGQINRSEADIVHLHWVQGEMLSIADISRINKPIVWTLHDMWPVCGAEHYASDHRWRDGYRQDNRPTGETGFDLNRWVWKRKRTRWRKPLQMVAPSRWLAHIVSESFLMKDWPVTPIPNPIDFGLWNPTPRQLSRRMFGLPPQARLILFGAVGGASDPRKGFDLLAKAMLDLRDNPSASTLGLQIVVFGESEPENRPDLGFPIHYVGRLYDDVSLRALYSSVDLTVIPSTQDNLPNLGIESLSCGTPLVAFQVGGLSDIVKHRGNGYLALPFSPADLAEGIRWVLRDLDLHGDALRKASLRSARRFASHVVAEAYREVYTQTLR